VAIDLASRNPSGITAVIVENTFQSLPRIVRDWPIIGPFSFLCMQKWKSVSKIQLIPPTTPILMLSGSLDEVVPQKHMKALWDLAKNRGQKKKQKQETEESDDSPKRDMFVTFPHGFHANTYVQPGYWGRVAKFLSMVLSGTQRTNTDL